MVIVYKYLLHIKHLGFLKSSTCIKTKVVKLIYSEIWILTLLKHFVWFPKSFPKWIPKPNFILSDLTDFHRTVLEKTQRFRFFKPDRGFQELWISGEILILTWISLIFLIKRFDENGLILYKTSKCMQRTFPVWNSLF